jgi:hypothetical protein
MSNSPLPTIDLEQLNNVQGGTRPDPDVERVPPANSLGLGIAGEAHGPGKPKAHKSSPHH